MKKTYSSACALHNLRTVLGFAFTEFGILLGLVSFSVFSTASSAMELNSSNPVVVSSTLVTGPVTGVPGTSGAAVRIADLDHGLVAGVMRYPYQGINLINTLAPFRWTQAGATLYTLPDDVVFEDSYYGANAITPDGTKVVGGAIYFDNQTTAPWMGTLNGGVEFFAVPNGLVGGAVAVSNDGSLVAGIVSGSGGSAPGQAVVWENGAFETLPSAQLWSEVGSQFEQVAPFPQRPMSSDGSIIVGASGPSIDQMQATKWVNKIEQPLSTGVAAQSSVATFVADNGVIFGSATLSNGNILLVRWDSNGNPQVLVPPTGFGVVRLTQ